MLKTELTITLKAGDGGNGKVSFYKNRKGPDGGNGGNGGNLIFTATSDIYKLSKLAKSKIISAPDGQAGMSNKKNSRDATNLELSLPLGSVITDTETKESWEVTKKNYKILVCKGGWGGKGNWEYRSGKNITPKYAQSGTRGQIRNVYINLKLIADFGLIGLPNAGKSSLLKELTAANPKVADYPFTTLEPNLGEYKGKIIADIPGLIEGASSGKGLGIAFLKHVERVSTLFHCISSESADVVRDYKTIRNELEHYNPKLLGIPEIILVTKTDIKSYAEIEKLAKQLKKLSNQVIPISIHDIESLKKLKQQLT